MKRGLAAGRSDGRDGPPGRPGTSSGVIPRRARRSRPPSFTFFFNRLANSRFESRRGALAFHPIGLPLGVARFGDSFHRAIRLHRLVVELGGNWFGVVPGLEDQPLILFTFTATDPHEGPFAFRFFAIRSEERRVGKECRFQWASDQ